MRVLLVTMYFPPAGGGGVARPLKLATHLPELGIETHVLAPDDPKWLHRDDRVGSLRNEAGDERLGLLLGPHGKSLDTPIRVRGHRVAQVRDPGYAGRLLDGRPDQVHGGRRRGGHEHVDLLVPHDPPRHWDRGQGPAHELVGNQESA